MYSTAYATVRSLIFQPSFHWDQSRLRQKAKATQKTEATRFMSMVVKYKHGNFWLILLWIMIHSENERLPPVALAVPNSILLLLDSEWEDATWPPGRRLTWKELFLPMWGPLKNVKSIAPPTPVIVPINFAFPLAAPQFNLSTLIYHPIYIYIICIRIHPINFLSIHILYSNSVTSIGLYLEYWRTSSYTLHVESVSSC